MFFVFPHIPIFSFKKKNNKTPLFVSFCCLQQSPLIAMIKSVGEYNLYLQGQQSQVPKVL